MAAIQAAGLYRRQLDQGRHEVLCPWWHAHTDGDQTGTVFMEAHYLGHAAAAFVCQHTSCSDKRLRELRDFLNLPPEAAPPGAAPALIEVDLTDLAQATLEPPRYIIKPIIPRGHTTLFGGHGGSGKSLVALTWAAHLAAGAAWGPFEMTPCRVLFVSLEDDGALVRWRLRRIADDYHLDLAQIAQRLAVIDASDAEPLAVEASTYGVRALVWSAVAEQIRSRAAGVDLLVLDNASDAFGGDENCRRQVRAFVKGITQMVRGSGGAVLLLAHIDKA